MVRAFTDEAVDPAVLERLCDQARRAPSAGNAQAVSFLVLTTAEARGRYWDVTLPPPRRDGFRWPGLVAAPVLVVVVVDPERYVTRYAEQDKAATGLGEGTHAWPVPYWWVDAGAAVQQLLLGIVDAGLGACFFGVFDHEPAVRESFGIPAGHRLVGTLAVGHPAPDGPGRSVSRPRRPLGEVLHREQW